MSVQSPVLVSFAVLPFTPTVKKKIRSGSTPHLGSYTYNHRYQPSQANNGGLSHPYQAQSSFGSSSTEEHSSMPIGASNSTSHIHIAYFSHSQVGPANSGVQPHSGQTSTLPFPPNGAESMNMKQPSEPVSLPEATLHQGDAPPAYEEAVGMKTIDIPK